MGSEIKKKERINYYDIAKGIGILLVVWAHAKGPFSSSMYLFHMPLFFLISGLLYSTKGTVLEFIKKKVFSLYIPFAFWNVLSLSIKFANNPSNVKQNVKNIGHTIFTLSKDGDWFGATWFLGALFLVSIVYKIVENSIPDIKTKDWILLILFTSITILGFQITLPFMLSRTLVLSVFFAVGAFIKKHREDLPLLDKKFTVLAISCFLFFVITAQFNSANMGKNEYRYSLLFVIGAFFMSYALIFFSKFMDERKNTLVKTINRGLIFLGQKSIDILIWQFVFFRVVIIIQILLNKEPCTVTNVLSYYPVYDTKGLWWIAYLIAGIAIPLLWGALLRFGPWGKLFKKIHIV